jgi:hypothetical protein
MGRTFLQQDTQIYASDAYNDAVSPGSTLQTSAANLQDDLNAIRSQLRRILRASSAGNWYDDVPFPGGSTARGIEQLASDLFDIERKRVLFRTQVLTDVTVPAAQNYVVLSVSGSQTPTQVAAVDSSTSAGAIVAAYVGTFGTAHTLDEVTGSNAISPKNLCIVRDAATGSPIKSSGKDVYALLQSESAVDGHTFNDTTQQVQLSFVRENSAGNDLEAVPASDVQNRSINYAYARRIFFDNIPEEAFLGGAFVDQSSATDVNLDNAVDNQSGPVSQAQTIDWRIADTFELLFKTGDAGRNLLRLAPTAAGDTVGINTDTLTFTSTNNPTFSKGISVDTGTVQINLGVSPGQIASTAQLTVNSGGTSDLRIGAAGELFFDDSNRTGSTYSQSNGIKLADTTAEWSTFDAEFGEVSLLNAIVQAKNNSSRTKGVAVVTTSSITANTNATGAGGTPNLDALLPAYASGTFTANVDVYLNGVLLRCGADASANHDVYPGDTPANGDLKFEFALQGGATPDVLTVIVYGN